MDGDSNDPLGDSAVDDWGPPASPEPAERYVERGELGRGGMGRVLLADDARLRRQVALKEARGEPDGPEAWRLRREARIIAALDHPAIVAVHDLGTRPDGRPYYVMRLVRGRKLSDAVPARAGVDRDLLRALLTACEAVGHAHDAGVVHRDLKPDNLLLGDRGEIQVVDWGLARVLDDEEWEAVLSRHATRAGQVLGTAAWMSPEQAAGEPVDARTDVWALGAILFFVLTGQAPFAGPTEKELVAQILGGSRRDLAALAPDVDPGLRAVVDRAMQPDPKRRFADAQQLAEALRGWLDRPPPPPRRSVVPALVAVALLAGAGGWTLRGPTAAVGSLDELHDARLVQARDAARRRDRQAAEFAAAGALELQESPGARGVLAALAAEPLPQRRASLPLPDCPQVSVARSADFLLCGDGSTVRRLGVDGALTWTIPLTTTRVELVAADAWAMLTVPDRRHPWLISAETGTSPKHEFEVGRVLRRLPGGDRTDRAVSLQFGADPELQLHHFVPGGQVETVRACGGEADVEYAWVTDDALLQVCTGRTVWRRDRATGADALVGEGTGIDSLAWTGDRDPASGRLAVGGFEGDVAVFDGQRWVLELQLSAESIRRVSVAPGGERLVALDGTGVAWLVPIDAPDSRVRLPGTARDVRFAPDGELLVVRDEALERWTVPAALPHALALPNGLTDLRWSGDEAVVAARDVLTLSPAGVRRWPATGDRIWSAVRDGRGRLLAGSVDAGLQVLDGPDAGAALVPDKAVRRVLPLTSGHVALGGYGSSPLLLDPTDRLTAAPGIPGFSGVGGSVSADGRRGVLLGTGGLIATLADGEPPTVRSLPTDPALRGATVTPDGARLLVLSGDELVVRGIDDEAVIARHPTRDATAIAASADGRWYAVGDLSGGIAVLDASTGQVRATLDGHRRKVSGLAFSPDGTELLSGSWDRTLRRWSLAPVAASRAEARRAVSERWGD